MTQLALYTYFRSSAAYRVRIALAYKAQPYTAIPVHLLRDGGQQYAAEYMAVNPQGRVPALVTEAGVITQSLAILEYLEETYPNPRLLPEDPYQRAKVRAFADAICCDIHPLNNLRVLAYLKDKLNISEEQKLEWYCAWIVDGFKALEAALAKADNKGMYCFGETPTMADVCLIPQVYNARRFACAMTAFPRLNSIYDHCMSMAVFKAAAPEAQADYE